MKLLVFEYFRVEKETISDISENDTNYMRTSFIE